MHKINITIDRKYFVVFNFCGWSQPRKFNTDMGSYLYVNLRMITVGTATMDIHKTPEETSSKRCYKAAL